MEEKEKQIDDTEFDRKTTVGVLQDKCSIFRHCKTT
jgi:hypothetical protein